MVLKLKIRRSLSPEKTKSAFYCVLFSVFQKLFYKQNFKKLTFRQQHRSGKRRWKNVRKNMSNRN